MGRAPCCDKANVKRGPWSPEEDAKLKSYIEQHGTGGNWIALPQKIGLKRCGKSCRLRWLNYLRPNIKHGGFTEEEENIICSLFVNIGSRWSIIAAQLPGRTDNDIKNYWNTRLKKKLMAKQRKELQASANSHIKREIISTTDTYHQLLLTQTPTQLPYWAENPLAVSINNHQLLRSQFSDDSTHDQMVVNGMNSYQNYPIQDQTYEDNSSNLLASSNYYYYANYLPNMEYDHVNGSGGLNLPEEVDVYLSNLMSFEATECYDNQVGNSSSTSNSAGSTSWGDMSSLVNTPGSDFMH